MIRISLISLWVWCALAMTGATPAQADDQPSATTMIFRATEASSGTTLNPHMAYLIDPGGKLSFDQVRHSTDRFTALSGQTGLGLINGALWLRLTLDLTDLPDWRHWWLELKPMAAAHVDYYRPDASGTYRLSAAGDELPFSARLFPYRQYLYPLADTSDYAQPPAARITVYWRLVVHTGTVMPVRLWEIGDWTRQALDDYLLLGLCFGIMFGLSLYNLLLYWRLRDQLFLAYFIMVCSYIVFAADLNGLASHALWPDHGWLGGQRNLFLTCLFGLTANVFPYLLLNQRKRRWFRWIMVSALALYGLAAVAVMVGLGPIASLVTNLAPIVTIPTLIIVSIARARDGYRPALYYLVGYGPVLYSISLLLLRGQGAVIADDFTGTAYIVAGAWEAVMFSQALAAHLDILKFDQQHALAAALSEQNARLEATARHQNELESTVAARTEALANEVRGHKQTSDDLRASQEELVHMAYYDSLTGQPNRRLLMEKLDQACAISRPHTNRFAFAMIDLDKFKQINDRLGHDAGDALLVEAGRRMAALLGPNDLLARLGGDEFAILFAPGAHDDAVRIDETCRRLVAAFVPAIPFKAEKMQTSPSIGIAWFGRDADNREDLFKAADTALYDAKNAGRNTFRYYRQGRDS